MGDDRIDDLRDDITELRRYLQEEFKDLRMNYVNRATYEEYQRATSRRFKSVEEQLRERKDYANSRMVSFVYPLAVALIMALTTYVIAPKVGG